VIKVKHTDNQSAVAAISCGNAQRIMDPYRDACEKEGSRELPCPKCTEISATVYLFALLQPNDDE
jgi:hypothetical protein